MEGCYEIRYGKSKKKYIFLNACCITEPQMTLYIRLLLKIQQSSAHFQESLSLDTKKRIAFILSLFRNVIGKSNQIDPLTNKRTG